MPEASPWALIGGLFTGLVAMVFWGLRLFATGKIVQGVHYDAARADRDQAVAAAHTAIQAAAGMMTSVGALSTQVERLAATDLRTVETVDRLAQGLTGLAAEVAGLRVEVRRLVMLWEPEPERGESRGRRP